MAATAALAAHHGRANQLPSCRPAAQCPSRPDARGPGQKLERTCRRTCVCGRAAVGGAAPVGSVADMGELQAWVARFPASQQACALTPVRSASGGWGLRADGPVSAAALALGAHARMQQLLARAAPHPRASELTCAGVCRGAVGVRPPRCHDDCRHGHRVPAQWGAGGPGGAGAVAGHVSTSADGESCGGRLPMGALPTL